MPSLAREREPAPGWAIPRATDIAFAPAVLQLALGRRAGPARVFLSTPAIADDLFAIIVIALFYSKGLDGAYLLASAGGVLLQVLLNRSSALAVRLRIGSLPPGPDRKRICGFGILAGIGFTLSISSRCSPLTIRSSNSPPSSLS